MSIETNTNNISWCSKIYGLLDTCGFEFLKHMQVPQAVKVAAQLISSSDSINHPYSTKLLDNAGNEYSFKLSFHTHEYQSKGDWIWVNNLDFNYNNEHLFSLNPKLKLIDIPYNNKNANAYWLLKNFHQELEVYFETESKFKRVISEMPVN